MRHFLLLLIVSYCSFIKVNGQAVSLASDNFGTSAQGTFSRTNWSAQNIGTGGSPSGFELRTTGGSSGYTGSSGGANFFTNLAASGYTKRLTYTTGISTVGYTNIQVKVGALRANTVPALNVLYSTDGSNYNTFTGNTATLTASWALYTFTLPSAAQGVSSLTIRFEVATNNSNLNFFRLDDFSVEGTPGNSLSFNPSSLTVPTTTAGTAGGSVFAALSKSGTSGNFTYGAIPSSVLMEYSTNSTNGTDGSWTAMNNAGATDLPQATSYVRASFRSTATASLSSTNVAFSAGGLTGTVNLPLSGTVQGTLTFGTSPLTIPTTYAGVAGSTASSTLTIVASTGNITYGAIPSQVLMEYFNSGSWTAMNNAGGTMPNTATSIRVSFRSSASVGTLSPTNVSFSGGGLAATTNLSISGTVDSPPGPPAPTGVTATTVCRSGTSTISFSTSGATSSRLYDAATNGNLVATGSTTSITSPSVSTTTTFYVASFDGSLESASRTAITVNVNPGLTSSLTGTANNGVAFSYTPTSSGSPTFSWSRGSLPSGVTVTSGSASGTGTINQTFVNTSGANQTVTFAITTTSGTCNGDVQNLVVTVSGTPAAVSSPSATTVCQSGTSTITFSAPAGATSTKLYLNSTGGTEVSTGTTTSIVTPSLTSSQTFYVAAVNGSLESSRTAVNVTVSNPQLSSSLSVTAGNGTSFTYNPTSSSSSPSFSWTRGALPSGVTASSGATSGSGGLSLTFTNTNASPQTVTYTYTVTSGGCTGSSQVVSVEVEGNNTFYSKTGATDFGSASSWATEADGSGNSPGSLTTNATLVVRSGANMTLSSGPLGVKSLVVQSGATVTLSAVLNLTGTLEVNGTLVHNNSSTINTTTSEQYFGATNITFSNTSTYEIKTYPATFNWPGALNTLGNLKFTGSGPGVSLNLGMPDPMTINGDFEFNITGSQAVRLSGSAFEMTIKGDLKVQDGILNFSNDPDGQFVVNLEGNLEIASGATLALNFGTTTTSSFNFTGTADATVTRNGTMGVGTNDIVNVTIAAGKKVTFNTSFVNRGNFTVNGILDLQSFNLENTSGDQTLTVSSTGQLLCSNTAGLKNSGNTAAVRVENLVLNSGTKLKFYGNSNAVTGLSTLSGITLSQLDFDLSSNAQITLDQDVTMNGPVSVGATTALITPDNINIIRGSSGTRTVTVNGTVLCQNSGGFISSSSGNVSFSSYSVPADMTLASTSIVNYNGGSQTLTSYLNYQGLTTSGSGTKTLNGSVAVLGQLNLNTQSITIGSNTLTIQGSLVRTSGTFVTTSTSSIVVSGTTSQLIWPAGLTPLSGNLTLDRSAGLILGGNLAVQNLTATSGTFSLSNFQLTINGDFSRTAGLLTGTSDPGSELVIAGTENLTGSLVFASNTTLNKLTISRTGIVNLGSDLAIGGTGNAVTISAGTLAVGTNSLSGASGNLTMTNGTLQISKTGTTPQPELQGAYTLSGGSVLLNGAGQQIARGGKSYFVLALAGSGNKTFSSDISGANSLERLTISESAAVILNGEIIGGNTTSLAMSGGELRFNQSYITVPTMGGQYYLSGGKISVIGGGATQQQALRANRTYFNLELNAAEGNYNPIADLAGNVTLAGDIKLLGSLTVMAPAVFSLIGSAALQDTNNTSGLVVESGAGLFFSDANGLTSFATCPTGVACGNVRTVTRSLNSGATYGVIGNAALVNIGDGLPSAISSFIVSKSSGAVSLTQPLTVNSSLSLFNGSVSGTNLTLASGAVINNSGGALTSAPTFGSTVNVSYSGSALQTTTFEIPNALTQSGVLNNLTISNSSGVLLATDAYVNGSVTFNIGSLTTGANKITLSSSAQLVNETIFGYVVGTVQTTHSVGTGSSIFGNMGYQIGTGSDNLGNVTLTRYTGAGTALPIQTVTSVNRRYSVDITGSQPSAGRFISFSWLSAEDNGMDFTNVRGGLYRRETPASAWVRVSSNFAYPTITGGLRTLSTTTYHFSDYTITEENGTLPVILTKFSGKVRDQRAELQWSTTFEAGNAGFRVEKSLDGQDYSVLGFVNGLGSSSGPANYEYYDLQFSQSAYYRLIQIDKDGAETVLPTIRLTAENELKEPTLRLFPNPVKAGQLVNIHAEDDSEVSLVIYDSKGSKVKTLTIKLDTGLNTLEAGTLNLSSGLYNLSFTWPDGKQQVVKLTLE